MHKNVVSKSAVYTTPNRGTHVYNFDDDNIMNSSVDKGSKNEDTISRNSRSGKVSNFKASPYRDTLRISELYNSTLSNKELLPPRPHNIRNKEIHTNQDDIKISQLTLTQSRHTCGLSRKNLKDSNVDASTAMNSKVYNQSSEVDPKVEVSQSKGNFQDNELKKLQRSSIPIKSSNNAILMQEINKVMKNSPAQEKIETKKADVKPEKDIQEQKTLGKRGPSLTKVKVTESANLTNTEEKKERQTFPNTFSRTKGIVNFTKLRYL